MNHLRVIALDPTDRWLSPVWKLGAWLYCLFGLADLYVHAKTVEELVQKLPDSEKIFELQFWCHGAPGGIGWNRQFCNENSLLFAKPLTIPNGLVWFRACSVVAGHPGREFVRVLGNKLQARIAAHTHIIGQWGMQSGLRVYDPQNPRMDWSPWEGLAAGSTPDLPKRMETSYPFAPNTVSVVTWTVPKKLFPGDKK